MLSGLTRKLPRLRLVEINLRNGGTRETGVEDFLEEVVSDELFIGRMKPKTRWHYGFIFIS